MVKMVFLAVVIVVLVIVHKVYLNLESHAARQRAEAALNKHNGNVSLAYRELSDHMDLLAMGQLGDLVDKQNEDPVLDKKRQ